MIEFSPAAIAAFIAMVGILSIVAQVHKEPANRMKPITNGCF